MDYKDLCFLAILWGILWASFLQFTPLGKFLAQHRTWVTVVIGVGVDLLIVSAIVALSDWLKIMGIIAVSSIAIIGRSLINEWQWLRGMMDDAKTQSTSGE